MTHKLKNKRRPSRLSLLLLSKNSLIFWAFLLATIVTLVYLGSQNIQFQSKSAYTADEVMTAYENGQFRVIHTQNTNMAWTPNFEYVSVLRDGTYRISDGALISEISGNTAFVFSPDGQYLVRQGDGIYSLPNFQKIVPARAEGISIANGEHIVVTGEITFSRNSQYVAIMGAGWYREEAESQSTEGYGVFRLSDGVQVVESDSFSIRFSANSEYASTQDGVFRLSDGEQLFEGDYTVFSPDTQYVYIYPHGVFRLHDSVQIIETAQPDNRYSAPVEATFSPDSDYFLSANDGVYRLSDGELLYPLSYTPAYGSPPYFINNSQYLVIPDGVYRIDDGELLFAWDWDMDVSPTQDIIHIHNNVYRLSNQQRLFSIEDDWNTRFSNQGTYFSAGNDGIYRVADGEFILSLQGISGYRTVFSPDEQYVTIDSRGLFNLNTQEQLFEIDGYVTTFTPDSEYFFAFDDTPTIYRVSDGHQYDHVWLIDIANGILQVGNTILVIDETQQNNNLHFIYTDYSNRSGLAVLEETNDSYLVGWDGETQWISKDGTRSFYIP